jgi:hypothetical protein
MDLTTQPKWVQGIFRVLAVGVLVGAFWLMRSCSWTPPDKVQIRQIIQEELRKRQ